MTSHPGNFFQILSDLKDDFFGEKKKAGQEPKTVVLNETENSIDLRSVLPDVIANSFYHYFPPKSFEDGPGRIVIVGDLSDFKSVGRGGQSYKTMKCRFGKKCRSPKDCYFWHDEKDRNIVLYFPDFVEIAGVDDGVKVNPKGGWCTSWSPDKEAYHQACEKIESDICTWGYSRDNLREKKKQELELVHRKKEDEALEKVRKETHEREKEMWLIRAKRMGWSSEKIASSKIDDIRAAWANPTLQESASIGKIKR